jgi:glucose-1-phosphate thymidylyltransferase
LLEAAQFVSVVQQRQGVQIACPEEIAFRQGFIDLNALDRLAFSQGRNGYGDYLARLLGELSMR